MGGQVGHQRMGINKCSTYSIWCLQMDSDYWKRWHSKTTNFEDVILTPRISNTFAWSYQCQNLISADVYVLAWVSYSPNLTLWKTSTLEAACLLWTLQQVQNYAVVSLHTGNMQWVRESSTERAQQEGTWENLRCEDGRMIFTWESECQIQHLTF